MVSEPVSKQIGTGKSLGASIGKIWYQEKVSKPVSEKFNTGTDFCRKIFGIFKIYNGYRYRIGSGTGIFSFFSGGIGTGTSKIWYWKQVLESVSVKFGIGKKSQNWYRKKFATGKSTGFGILAQFDPYKFTYSGYRMKFFVFFGIL